MNNASQARNWLDQNETMVTAPETSDRTLRWSVMKDWLTRYECQVVMAHGCDVLQNNVTMGLNTRYISYLALVKQSWTSVFRDATAFGP